MRDWPRLVTLAGEFHCGLTDTEGNQWYDHLQNLPVWQDYKHKCVEYEIWIAKQHGTTDDWANLIHKAAMNRDEVNHVLHQAAKEWFAGIQAVRDKADAAADAKCEAELQARRDAAKTDKVQTVEGHMPVRIVETHRTAATAEKIAHIHMVNDCVNLPTAEAEAAINDGWAIPEADTYKGVMTIKVTQDASYDGKDRVTGELVELPTANALEAIGNGWAVEFVAGIGIT